MKNYTSANKKNRIIKRFIILFTLLIVSHLSYSCFKEKNVPPVYSEIPDANFKAYLKTIVPDAFTPDNKFISNHSSVVSYDKRISVNGRNINSLSGIEYFTALTRLDCMENQLKILDISKNTNLKELFCGYNQLTKLDVSKNANLSIIHCYNNQLTNLDISKNNKLKELNCCYNQIFTINLGKNEVLRKIFCPYNQLTLLDVSKNIALVELNCINNPSNKIVIINPNRLKRLYIDSYSKCNHPSIKTFKDEGGELFDSFFQSIPPFSCNN
ncbi:leucine-rich repeat domain-containing protein [Flavobacterium daejeonense]|uniref:leucine-rich repeat domain-containing protein n=1 Tax=Flavobacterium daejeonense TaxID=350893 RepID=UPI000689C3DA|nr:hypothetical protein [Flavobacterium daejeonense]